MVDVCQSFLIMQRTDPELALSLGEAYASRLDTTADEILDAWLCVVAGARLADNVPAEEEALRFMVDGQFQWHRA